MDIGARLRAITDEVAQIRTEIQILDEQIAFQQEVAEDARIRALVSETPLADRDATEAGRDLERMQRNRADAHARRDALRAEQDALLERLIDEKGR